MTTKADCAQKIAAYLANQMTHEELVKRAESALVDEDFSESEAGVLLRVLSDLSASRAPSFLSRVEDYQALLRELGFLLEPRLVAA